MAQGKGILFLCGQKCCGKTYYGRLLSETGHCSWYDLDEEILKSNSGYNTIREIFRTIGRETFRQLETSTLGSLIAAVSSTEQTKPVVISLGGGSLESPKLTDLLRKSGRCVFLKTSEDVLFSRMTALGLPPYITEECSRSGRSAEAVFHDIFKYRNEIYSSFCEYVVSLEDFTAKEIAEQLLSLAGETWQTPSEQ